MQCGGKISQWPAPVKGISLCYSADVFLGFNKEVQSRPGTALALGPFQRSGTDLVPVARERSPPVIVQRTPGVICPELWVETIAPKQLIAHRRIPILGTKTLYFPVHTISPFPDGIKELAASNSCV
jgi:hypothetical protein